MEIGSIFEIDIEKLWCDLEKTIPLLPVQRKGFVGSSLFNTGRSAIEALLSKLKQAGYNELYLPTYICDSVKDAALRAGMSISYYPVSRELSVDWDNLVLPYKSVLYVVQYFGQNVGERISNFISKAHEKGIKIVEDLSLSLLSDGNTVGFGDYVIGSLRKWFPIIDGGILLSRDNSIDFEFSDAANDYTLYYFVAQILKQKYIDKGDKGKAEKDIFLSYNKMGMDTLFKDYTIRKISRVSLDLLKGLDYRSIADRRISNYDTLKKLLASIPQVNAVVNRTDRMVPLGMVIIVEDRDSLYNYLISKDIYCNIHWRLNESTQQHIDSRYLSNHCLTIPCDQRYGEPEMYYIYEMINKFGSFRIV